MPALQTCGKAWNVGTDDFTLPALLAVLIRLVSIGLTAGVLIYLFFGPDGCPDQEPVPVFLYASLFALVFVLLLAILNENIIFSISLRGSIMYEKDRRNSLQYWLFIRVGLIIVEFLCLLVCAVAVFGPAPYAAGGLECSEFHDGPLLFAQIIVVIMLIVILVYFIGFGLYLDPFGLLCSPSLWHDLEKVEKAAENPMEEVDGEILAYAKNSRLGNLHRSHIGYGKIFRKLRGLLCCLNSNGNRSRSTAMHEMALAFHTVFSSEDKVTTDIVAGLILLSQYQKRLRQKCTDNDDMEGFYLHKQFSDLTFKYMPKDQTPKEYKKKEKIRLFDPGNPAELKLLDELVYYMKYAMGIYGWTLHVFDSPICGLCQLCSVTCCRCTYRRWHHMAHAGADEDIPRVIDDNCCMSGLGTVRLRSELSEPQVLYISYKNDVFLAPFSICADRDKKKIVLTVRGTLSIKDALTDLSVSMEEMEEEDKLFPFQGGQFVHKGMYATATLILREITENRLLSREFEKPEFKDFDLVLTGHSLGAGVVSVLSVMLKRLYPNLKCYAFSPPGCIFSFPLAWHSRDFIHSVVLGNDMISRVTFQSLFYLKWQMTNLLQKCRQSKFQVLFRPRFIDRLPDPILRCLFTVPHSYDVDEDDCNTKLEEQMSKKVDGAGGNEKRKKFLKAVEIVKAKQKAGIKSARAQQRWKKLRKAVFKGNHVHGFMQGMVEGEQIAAFPPGKILHIHVEYSKKSWLFHHCYPDTLQLRHVNGEDLAVIVVDRGMIDDHLPNNVLAALLKCQRQARRDAKGIRKQDAYRQSGDEARGSSPAPDEIAERRGVVGNGKTGLGEEIELREKGEREGAKQVAIPVEDGETGLGEEMELGGKGGSYEVTAEVEPVREGREELEQVVIPVEDDDSMGLGELELRGKKGSYEVTAEVEPVVAERGRGGEVATVTVENGGDQMELRGTNSSYEVTVNVEVATPSTLV